MTDATLPDAQHGLASAALAAMAVCGVLIGWMKDRGRRGRGGGISTDGWLGDGGAEHNGW